MKKLPKTKKIISFAKLSKSEKRAIKQSRKEIKKDESINLSRLKHELGR